MAGLECLKLLLYKKAEKEKLSRSKSILRTDLSKHFGGGFVSGLDLSRSWTYPKISGPIVSKSFRAGSVLWPQVAKSLGPEVSHGLTWFTAGSALELFLTF